MEVTIKSFADEMEEVRTSSFSAEQMERQYEEIEVLDNLFAGSETISEFWNPAKAALRKHSNHLGFDNGELFILVGEALDGLRKYARACQRIARFNAVKSTYP